MTFMSKNLQEFWWGGGGDFFSFGVPNCGQISEWDDLKMHLKMWHKLSCTHKPLQDTLKGPLKSVCVFGQKIFKHFKLRSRVFSGSSMQMFLIYLHSQNGRKAFSFPPVAQVPLTFGSEADFWHCHHTLPWRLALCECKPVGNCILLLPAGFVH